MSADNATKMTQATVPKCYLKSALAYLRHETQCKHEIVEKRAKSYCWPRTHYHGADDCDSMLLNYHTQYIIRIIRNAILSHDWETALDLLTILLQKGKKGFTKYLVRACLPVIFHHHGSTPDFLFSFFESVTGYVEDKDIEEFIMLLFQIKNDIRPGVVRHRCATSTVITDPRFQV